MLLVTRGGAAGRVELDPVALDDSGEYRILARHRT
jgi:hypothetical protein